MKVNPDNILYIDDERENLTGFRYVFKRYFNVHTASSAKEGLKILKQVPVKVLISDQRMPETTGVELLEEVATNYPEIYRIILTGYTEVADIINAINKGKVFQFIRKPWDKDEVKVIIDNAIKLYDLNSKNKQLIVSLEASNTQLEEINSNLEDKVRERTKKIEQQNVELEKHRNNLEELVKQRTRELERAKEKAEESDRLKTSFLANVSHEIRTPMNAIMGFSELLIAEDHEPTEKKEFKEQIILNSKSLLRLIDDIIDIAKIEANQVSLDYKGYNLHKILDELQTVYSKLKDEQNKKDVELELEINNGEDIFIMTDKIRLQQILSNLIGNALKFTEKGGISFGYKLINDDQQQPFLRFYVTDTGIGIPNEAHTYIFDRFRKADLNDDKLFRGTGLGLFISKSLVEKFEGRIWLESVPKQGSKFFFEIPYIPAGNEDIVESNNDRELTFDSFDFDGKLILVAEDEDASYTFIEKVMKYTNAKLIRTRNGQETLDVLKTNQQPISLILMDIQMPVMSGFQAIQHIKENNYRIPIIAQTAYALSNQKKEILKTGCDAFLSKPIKSFELLNTIKQYIQ